MMSSICSSRDGVERGGRLVDSRIPAPSPRPGPRTAAAAARRRARRPFLSGGPWPRPRGRRRRRAFSTRSSRHRASCEPREAKAVSDVFEHPFGERVGPLEHHADAQPAPPSDRRLGSMMLTPSGQQDLALVAVVRVQVVHPVEAAEQRALAAAGRADQRGDRRCTTGMLRLLRAWKCRTRTQPRRSSTRLLMPPLLSARTRSPRLSRRRR